MPVSQTLPNITSVSIIRRSCEKIWLPVWKDWSGAVITNDAGLLPIMPVYEPVTIAIYHITRFKTYSDALFNAEFNALNNDNWRSFSAYQCWISEIHTNGTETKGATTGEDVHYVIRCIDRADGWKCVVPNVGYAYKGTGTEIKGFKTSDGTPYIGNIVASTGVGTAGTAMNLKTPITKKAIAFSSVTGL